MEVASKAKACRVKSSAPILVTSLTDAPVPSCANQPRPTCESAQMISAPRITDRTAPIRSVPGLSRPISPGGPGSSRGTLSSMTTNRNRTMMAPA
jgi:hypothetical protein